LATLFIYKGWAEFPVHEQMHVNSASQLQFTPSWND